MKLFEIYRELEKIAPMDLCEEWDNSGILIHANEDIETTLVTLDITSEVIAEAIEKDCQLIISHHPVIFKPIRKITKDSLVFQLIRNNISVISMHTNLDKTNGGVNDVLANKLGLEDIEEFSGIGRKGKLVSPIPVKDFAQIISKLLNVPVKYSLPDAVVHKVAVFGGSAGEYWRDLIAENVDLLLTGEASYHDILDAKHLGIPIIVAGHWKTEVGIVKELAEVLSSRISEVVFVIAESDKNPISYCYNDWRN